VLGYLGACPQQGEEYTCRLLARTHPSSDQEAQQLSALLRNRAVQFQWPSLMHEAAAVEVARGMHWFRRSAAASRYFPSIPSQC